MILAIALVAALQAQPPQVQPPQPPQAVLDSARRQIEKQILDAIARREATREKRELQGGSTREVRRREVTTRDLETAFRDPTAREILNLARRGRLEQDSALRSYDATAYQRISANLGFSRLGRDRLVFRTERVDRVRWDRDKGLWLEVLGARTALPGIPEIGEEEAGKNIAATGEMAAVPYYPGYEPLWIGPMATERDVNELGPVHPMAAGSEAYYTYRTGQPSTIRLSGGRTITLRELEVRPRESKWNLVVGSMWFDDASGQLVRAAYRFAVPMEIDQFVLEQDRRAFEDVPIWVKPLIFPMRGTVSAVTIEYSLHAGRFWLPRSRSAEGVGQASFVRVPAKFEQSFTYASVNGTDTMPALPPLPQSTLPPDSLTGNDLRRWMDSATTARAIAILARRDSLRNNIRRAPSTAQCDTAAYRVSVSRGYGDSRTPFASRVPCDVSSLADSPLLPPSIFDAGDELFDLDARNALIAEALAMGVQPPFTLNPSRLPPPSVAYGLQLTRFNRVEGFSTGLRVTQVVGGGYTVDATARLGLADRKPNVDVGLTRSNLARSFRFSGYSQLVSVSDWGNPLSFGSSFAAAVFGRDEGFYYRASGAEVSGRTETGKPIEWRMFVEHHATASAGTKFALMGDNSLPNIIATETTTPGAAVRIRDSRGTDPLGLRLFTDLRVEGGRADSIYGRAAIDLTATEQVGWLSAAVTASAGSSVGGLPIQRHWFLGGTSTIRGQSPDTARHGNAFWRARAELGTLVQGARPVIFGDVGWVGDRTSFDKVGVPMSGAGIGASMLDGLIRLDVSRGINPVKQWRVDFYLDAIF